MSQLYSIEDLKQLMANLRDPEFGCPWDITQSYKTITSSTIEEAYEVVDAIENCEMTDLKDELGDLLFQVIFYSQLGAEDAHFTFDGVVDGIVKKLLRRHPHVFPDGTLSSFASPATNSNSPSETENNGEQEGRVKQQWEAIKKQERDKKGMKGVLADVPVALPAITRAQKLQKRASSVGFDWSDIKDVSAKIQEEIGELEEAVALGDRAAIEEEAGDFLFSAINLMRHLQLDGEACLRRANLKFERRFSYVETEMAKTAAEMCDSNQSMMEGLWSAAKKSGL